MKNKNLQRNVDLFYKKIKKVQNLGSFKPKILMSPILVVRVSVCNNDRYTQGMKGIRFENTKIVDP